MTSKKTFRAAAALGLLFAAFASNAQTTPGDQVWVRRYDRPIVSQDTAVAATTDKDGNVIVAVNVMRTEYQYGIALIKYSGAGQALWTNYYTSGPFGYNDQA